VALSLAGVYIACYMSLVLGGQSAIRHVRRWACCLTVMREVAVARSSVDSSMGRVSFNQHLLVVLCRGLNGGVSRWERAASQIGPSHSCRHWAALNSFWNSVPSAPLTPWHTLQREWQHHLVKALLVFPFESTRLSATVLRCKCSSDL
jgi:hypothetical protein